MPWQRLVADVALEVNPETKRLAYRMVILTIPRQMGKTTLLLPVWLQRAITWPNQEIAWTMQSGKDARSKWEDEHLPVILASPLRLALGRPPRRQNGQEAVFFKNGSVQRLMASTMKSGHGKSLDLGIVDEAFAQPDDRLEQAMRPAMRTRSQPQMWLVSTMGTAVSTWFHAWCDAGRQTVDDGGSTDIAYFEWSADPAADPGDPATWWSCMPALGYTVTEEAIRGEFEASKMTPDGIAGFRRASLNQRTINVADPVVPTTAWAATLDRHSQASGPLVLAVDMPPDRSSVTLAVAGRRADGSCHVEIIERRAGTSWLRQELERLVDAHPIGSVALAPGGPAGGVLPDVQAAVGDRLRMINSGEFASACQRFYDLVIGGGMRHLGQDELDVAVAAAHRKFSGDSFRWARRSMDVDISPLCAASIAAWAVDALPAPEPAGEPPAPFAVFA